MTLSIKVVTGYLNTLQIKTMKVSNTVSGQNKRQLSRHLLIRYTKKLNHTFMCIHQAGITGMSVYFIYQSIGAVKCFLRNLKIIR